MIKQLINSSRFIIGLLLAGLVSTSALAQADKLRAEYPELAKLYNAFDVTQAEMFDAIAAINADPATQQARMDLKMQLEMAANMDMHEMMAAGVGHGDSADMSMPTLGPYGELEVQARSQMGRLVRGDHADEAAAAAFIEAESIPMHAARVMSWGRQFENNLWGIYADPSTSMYEKGQSVDALVQSYVTDDARHAVSLQPKSADLYLEHDYANGLKAAFPRLSGLLWANQWLQLASLEAIIIGQVDPQFAGNVDVTLERFWNKVGSETGMTMFPAPSEMPSAPAISPQLYSQSPQAAVIIDNLNMLEAALADIIAYPNVDDREAKIDQLVAQFTAQEDYLADEMDYLLSALRGGIFNQGGPAIGELGRSERNRSRSAMDMQHTMIMSSPQ